MGHQGYIWDKGQIWLEVAKSRHVLLTLNVSKGLVGIGTWSVAAITYRIKLLQYL